MCISWLVRGVASFTGAHMCISWLVRGVASFTGAHMCISWLVRSVAKVLLGLTCVFLGCWQHQVDWAKLLRFRSGLGWPGPCDQVVRCLTWVKKNSPKVKYSSADLPLWSEFWHKIMNGCHIKSEYARINLNMREKNLNMREKKSEYARKKIWICKKTNLNLPSKVALLYRNLTNLKHNKIWILSQVICFSLNFRKRFEWFWQNPNEWQVCNRLISELLQSQPTHSVTSQDTTECGKCPRLL